MGSTVPIEPAKAKQIGSTVPIEPAKAKQIGSTVPIEPANGLVKSKTTYAFCISGFFFILISVL